MQVQSVMSSHLITVDKEETVAAASRLLSRHNIGALPVTSREGKLVGMLTDRDVAVRCVAANFDPNVTRVRTIMSTGPVTVPADATTEEAAKTMGRHQVRRLPVTANGRLVGMVSQADFAAAAPASPETAKAFFDVFDSAREV
ncbi:MAG: CBS domain-containing protein [Oscillospiraceae bacterium]|nr:CBS domain-containing protein [Oscillospiraceae bacterium]MEE3459990.1 CBS domain-containing protein [Candidatus Faecousia sp.]MBQ1756376.1 CBS domain-containing protein [Oscillospiraceae bacterium]MBQ2143923.1 CBS domain-containing protein [Oscillospiraceae bacterium]MBQ2202892.1 CBS domain-containing protein [Oscillospiraceae bacterium]